MLVPYSVQTPMPKRDKGKDNIVINVPYIVLACQDFVEKESLKAY